MTIELMKLKTTSGWSDTSFLALLELLTKVLPKPNGLPSSTNQAKKIICLLSLGIEKIYACPNHCILYQKELKFKDGCPRCNASRYNKTVTVRSLSMNPTKRAKKGERKSEKNVTPDQDIEGSKERKVPALVMSYLPVIYCLKRMFSNPRDAELLL
jgi:hypothetical protein